MSFDNVYSSTILSGLFVLETTDSALTLRPGIRVLRNWIIGKRREFNAVLSCSIVSFEVRLLDAEDCIVSKPRMQNLDHLLATLNLIQITLELGKMVLFLMRSTVCVIYSKDTLIKCGTTLSRSIDLVEETTGGNFFRLKLLCNLSLSLQSENFD